LRATGDEVALKVQRPFLRRIYDQDLAVLTKVATFFDSLPGTGKNVGGVSSSWTKILNDTENILYREIDYRDEASNSVRFANDFGLALHGKPAANCTAKSKDGEDLPSAAEWLRTPHIFEEACTEQLLVMEFVPSIKITDMAKLEKAGVSENDKLDLSDSLARAYLRQLCCNCFFSTDPHAGTYHCFACNRKNVLSSHIFK
jgi:predicted unusual protein kinase regulating ubiquinone biosynthesis (AarF/ABC1/UbiB family)